MRIWHYLLVISLAVVVGCGQKTNAMTTKTLTLSTAKEQLNKLYKCDKDGVCSYDLKDKKKIESLKATIQELEADIVWSEKNDFILSELGVKKSYSPDSEKEDLKKITKILTEVHKRNRYMLDKNKFGVADRHESVIKSYDALVWAQSVNLPLHKFKSIVLKRGGRVEDFDWAKTTSIHDLKLLFDCETTMYLLSNLCIREGVNPQRLEDVFANVYTDEEMITKAGGHALVFYFGGVECNGKRYGSGEIYTLEQIPMLRLAKDRKNYEFIERRRLDLPLWMSKKFSKADNIAIHNGKKVWMKIDNCGGGK